MSETNKTWRERFDEEFDAEWPSVRSYTNGALQEWVKSFIESELSRVKKIVEGRRKGNGCDCDDTGCSGSCENSYNTALDDILKALEEEV